MPERPSAYSGDTFVASGSTTATTTPIGGYGSVSSGMYSLIAGQSTGDSGYKPFGTLGQGSETNLNVNLRSTENRDRVMLVTLQAVGSYDMSANPDITVIKVGSYNWTTTDFTTPTVPDEPSLANAD